LLAHLRSALAKCVSDLGPNGADCRKLLVRKVAVQLRLGLIEEASDALPLLETFTEDQRSPTLVAEASLAIFKLASIRGEINHDSPQYSRVRVLAESASRASLNKNFRVKALMALTDAELRQGSVTNAELWLEKLNALLRRPDGSLPASLEGSAVYSLQGMVRLQHGESLEGLEALRHGLDNSVRALGVDHPAVQLYSLNVAIASDAVGRPRDALSIVNHAEPILRNSLGTEVPTYQRIKSLRDRLERAIRSGDPANQEFTGRRSASQIRSSVDFF